MSRITLRNWYVIMKLQIETLLNLFDSYGSVLWRSMQSRCHNPWSSKFDPQRKKKPMLLRVLSDDGYSDDDTDPSAATVGPKKPWLKEYHLYLDVRDEPAPGQSIVQWWGGWIVAF